MPKLSCLQDEFRYKFRNKGKRDTKAVRLLFASLFPVAFLTIPKRVLDNFNKD